jgi:hypothetical protein
LLPLFEDLGKLPVVVDKLDFIVRVDGYSDVFIKEEEKEKTVFVW